MIIPRTCWENLPFLIELVGKVLLSFHTFKYIKNIALHVKVKEKHVTIYLIFQAGKCNLVRNDWLSQGHIP